MIQSFYCILRYPAEDYDFEPYVRPEASIGFVQDSQPMDQYGRRMDFGYYPPYGNDEDDTSYQVR